MKLRVGWMILATSVLVAFAGGFLPEWWGVGLEVVAFAMAVGVVAADVKAIRRSKAKGGVIPGGDPGNDSVPAVLSPGWHFVSREAMEDYLAISSRDGDLSGVWLNTTPLTDEQVQAFKEEWTKRYGTKDEL